MRLLPLAYLGFVALGLPDGLLGVAWPSMRAAFELSQAGMGLVLAGAGAGYLAAGAVAGSAMHRLGIGRVLATGTALLAGGLAVEAGAPSWPVLVGGAGLAGLGAGAVDAGLNGYASLRFSPRQLNWLHGCYSLGTTLGPLAMVALLARGASWRAGYAGLALATVAMAGLFWATRRGWTSAIDPRAGRPRAAWRSAAADRLVWLQAALFFVYTGLEVMLGQWSFTVLSEGRGLSAAAAGLWTSLYWGSIAAGRFAFGALVDRVGADRLLRLCSVVALAGVLLFATGPRMLGPPGLVLAGLALAPIFPTLVARAPARLGPAVALHAVGFSVSAAMLGAAALPALAGAVAERAGLGAVGWSGVAAALLMLLLHERVLARTAIRVGRVRRP